MNKLKIFLLSFIVTQTLNSKFIYKEFDVSMNKASIEYKAKYNTTTHLSNKLLLDNLKKLYDKNCIKKPTEAAAYKIPKIIHQIWIGPLPVPELYKKLQKTWQTMHPDWTYMLWTDKEVNNLSLVNRQFYLLEKAYSAKADILRYEILYVFGGVYIDMDCECLQPFDILHKHYDLYTGIIPNNARAVLANGIIGATPHHPFLKMLIDEMYKFQHEKDPFKRNGVFYFSSQFGHFIAQNKQSRVIAFPHSYFYPFKWHHGTKIGNDEKIRPESFAIHYWGSTIEQKEFLYKQKR